MDASSSTLNESLNSSITIGYSDSSASAHINQSTDLFDIQPLPPAIQALVNSNEAPLHSQMLQSNLRDAQTTLSNLEVCLDSMNTEIALLTAKRDQIIVTIKTYRDVLHPIRRTPPEVLLEIFSYCVPFVDTTSAEKCQEINSLNTKFAPWTFGQVCKHWRFIVLECPRLWSSLSLNVDQFLTTNFILGRQIEYKAIDLLSNHLRRSKDCPLTIAVQSFQALSPIFSLICSHSERWSNVLLSLHAGAFPQLSLVKGRLPRLKNLHLRNLEGWDDRIPAIDAFKYAPNLCTIRASEIPGFATNLLLPWGQLTYCPNMCLTSSEQDSIILNTMKILSQAVKLRHAILTSTEYARRPSLTSLTPHRALSGLTIGLFNCSDLELLTQFLDAVTLPALSTLYITTSSRETVRHNVQCLIRLVERSKCRLIRLRLKGFQTDIDDDPHFRLLLTLVPALGSLDLDRFPNSLLNALMVLKEDDSEPPLLPRLRQLYMSIPSLYMDQNLFIDVVESRVQRTNLDLLATSSQLVWKDAARARLESLNIERNIF
ncbi:hypothetical protein F5878DRAFT_726788 [Lentinula raphanica]|uniref:F-box domain-containing protein n=1 Tax=Lentinula raphanica TaxID=153919 RepID=A0AA38P588_9AGAR|nr:hypothetical protein F5878DRAFT_726788 [Lentinula raphanica]